MKLLQILKYLLVGIGICFFFVDWIIAVCILVVASIIHTIPLGPNVLLNTITGYLIIGGVVAFFYDWRLAVGLIVTGLLVAKFHAWGNKKNFEYYDKDKHGS